MSTLLHDHFTRMMEAAANYVEPTTYIARHPDYGTLGPCKFNTEFPEPTEHHSESAKADIKGRRDQAFIRDMIYMLDGPEQRAATSAQAMSAGTAKTEGLGGDSPASAVRQDAPEIKELPHDHPR